MLRKDSAVFRIGLLSPGIIIFALMTLFPIGYTLYNSFYNLYLLKPADMSYIGVQNYIDGLSDPLFRLSLWNTFVFMFFTTLTESSLGLLLAAIVHSLGKKTDFLRFLIILPNLIPPVTIILIWQNLLGYHGLINKLFTLLGFEPVNWFMHKATAMGSLIFIDIWQWTPFAFLLFFAALTSVPKNQYEAAKIDGAGPFANFINVTVPHIQSTLFMVVTLRLIDTVRLFDKVNILTKGGPANATTTVTQFIYQKGIGNLKIGYASAISICMTLIVIFIGMPALIKNFRREKPKGV